MIVLEGVTKTYGDVRAVEDITTSFRSGEVTGLLGPNGAGKTTLMKVALGLISPTAGSVSIGGIDVRSHPQRAYRHVTAVLEGARNVYWRLTPLENMAFFAAMQGIDPRSRREHHQETLETLGLAEKSDVPVNELSRGMKQKVSIACALARETPALILDEPTLGLDVDAARRVATALVRLAETRDKTIVVSSHDMDLVADVCDRVVVLKDGQIVADEPPEALIAVTETQQYRVVVHGSIGRTRRRELSQQHQLERWQTSTERTEATFVRPPGASLYPLLRDLHAAGIELEEISPAEIDLEDTFLRITGSGAKSARRQEVGLP